MVFYIRKILWSGQKPFLDIIDRGAQFNAILISLIFWLISSFLFSNCLK